MKKKLNSLLLWTPRVLSIAFILFLIMFSLDVFEPGLSAWEIIGGLFMHNIAAIVLAIILLISWKHEIVGGIAFLAAGLLYIIRLGITMIANPPFQFYFFTWSLVIAGPAILIGILYLIVLKNKKQN